MIEREALKEWLKERDGSVIIGERFFKEEDRKGIRYLIKSSMYEDSRREFIFGLDVVGDEVIPVLQVEVNWLYDLSVAYYAFRGCVMEDERYFWSRFKIEAGLV